MNLIVLNENEWAKNMIDSCTFGDKPFETIRRVARYYIDKGYSKKDARTMLDRFIIRCDAFASIAKWSDTLDRAMTIASKKEAININEIDITKDEMGIIRSIKGRQLQRLAFTLLCLAKYWDIANGTDTHWVNNKYSDIMRMANINTSVKRQSMMYHTLNELGLIEFSRIVDNTNVRVAFVSDGESELGISDFRNLGYQYMMHNGDTNYYKCQNCGITVKFDSACCSGEKRIGRPRKYCKNCASEIKIKAGVNRTMHR